MQAFANWIEDDPFTGRKSDALAGGHRVKLKIVLARMSLELAFRASVALEASQTDRSCHRWDLRSRRSLVRLQIGVQDFGRRFGVN